MNDRPGVIVHGALPTGLLADDGSAGRRPQALHFDDVVARYRKPLTAAAVHLCGDPEAAQDAVQETFLAACEGLKSLRDPGRVGAWLFAVLRRKAAATRRACSSETPLPPDLPAAPEPDALVSAVVREQLSKLSREDREVLAGHYLLGLSYQELSEALGIREGAVRVRCFRAKERMRELLQGAGLHGRVKG